MGIEDVALSSFLSFQTVDCVDTLTSYLYPHTHPLAITRNDCNSC